MELIKLTMLQMNGMLDQYTQPHSMDLRKHVIDDIARVTDNGSNINAFRLAKHATGLLVPDTTKRRNVRVHAPNGWETDRLAFSMVVAINNRSRTKTYLYIVGTTDMDGSSGTDSRIRFDSKMRLYFNNVTKIHMNESSLKGNSVWVPRIQAHDQILNRDSLMGFDGRNVGFRERPVSLRPTDLFRRRTGAVSFAKSVNDDNVNNMCGAFTSQLKASSRINNSTSYYMHRNLSSYIASASEPERAHYHDDGNVDTLDLAHNRVEETDLEIDPYFEELKDQTRILDDGYITYGELLKLNPDYDWDKLAFGRRKSGRRLDLSNQAGWKGTDNETLAARIICQSLPGIMINSMYSELEDMVLKSHVRPGQNHVEVAMIWPYVDGISVKANFPYFEGACNDVLIHEATCGGRFEIEARINANIDTLIKIHIRVDGGPEAYFEFPACMDAGQAPTMETDHRSFDALAKGVVGLAAELSARRLRDDPNTASEPVILTSSERRRDGERSERRSDQRDGRSRDSDRDRDRRPSRSERDW